MKSRDDTQAGNDSVNLVVVLWVPGGPILKSWIFTLLEVTLTNLDLVTIREGGYDEHKL